MPDSAANSLQKSLGIVESQSCGPLGVLEDALESARYQTVCVSFGTSRVQNVLADVMGKQPHSVFVGIRVTCLQSF